ncbi:MAG: FHA domain-containing protein [Dehalococcoidia bacterium]
MGRVPNNSIQLLDDRLSREHARIDFRGGRFWVTDLNSTNGTFLNGARMTAPHAPLTTGDEVALGATRIAVQLFTPAAG